MDDVGSEFMEESAHSGYKAGIWQCGMPRLAGVGVQGLKETTPSSDSMDSDASVVIEPWAIRTCQRDDLDLVATRGQLVRKHLYSQITPANERGRVTVGDLEDPHAGSATGQRTVGCPMPAFARPRKREGLVTTRAHVVSREIEPSRRERIGTRRTASIGTPSRLR